MKRCPNCGETYSDDEQNYCLSDGGLLEFVIDSTRQETVVISQLSDPQTLKPAAPGKSPVFVFLLIGIASLVVGGAAVFFAMQAFNAGSTNSNRESNSESQESLDKPAAKTPEPERNKQATDPRKSEDNIEFAVRTVRAGTADGKRLRVVADLAVPASKSGEAVKFETLEESTGSNQTKILVFAKTPGGTRVKYESSQAGKMGSVSVKTFERGTEIVIAPKLPLYLKDVFVIPPGSSNPNERLVIDLCTEKDCPSLKPGN